jgi:hypothetical protein
MSGASIKFNRDLEKQVAKLAQDKLREIARANTAAFEQLRLRYQGRPVSEIKPALRSAWSRANGGNITDPELTNLAEKISAGVRVSFQAK